MQHSLSLLNNDPFYRDAANNGPNDISLATTQTPLWDPTLYTRISPNEIRSGKAWRVTAGGQINSHPESPVEVTVIIAAGAQQDNPNNDEAARWTFTIDPTSDLYQPVWYTQAIVVCRSVAPGVNVGNASLALYTGLGLFSFGGITAPFQHIHGNEPSYDIPTNPLQCITILAAAAAEGWGVGLDFACIESLN